MRVSDRVVMWGLVESEEQIGGDVNVFRRGKRYTFIISRTFARWRYRRACSADTTSMHNLLRSLLAQNNQNRLISY